MNIGDICPEFEGINQFNQSVKSKEMIGKKYLVIFFYPKDFTFICPTEIKGMDMLTPEATVVGFSGDNEFCKLAWKENNELIKHIQHHLLYYFL